VEEEDNVGSESLSARRQNWQYARQANERCHEKPLAGHCMQTMYRPIWGH